jgi:hypothetical protein
MAELMQNPIVMSRVQAEVRREFKGQVTEEGLDNLSYMRCIIKETLRLHTPGPLLIPRECREQCKILVGLNFPNYTICLNSYTKTSIQDLCNNEGNISRRPNEIKKQPEYNF